MDRRQAFDLAYLACAAAFIIGLKRLSSPRTAVRGNQLAAVAMGVVIVVTLVDSGSHNLAWILGGMVIGGAIGAYSARAVKMTAMPQMVALFNGVGGGAAALIAVSEYHDRLGLAVSPAKSADHLDPVLDHRRSDQLRRQHGRLRQAAGGPAGTASDAARPEG